MICRTLVLTLGCILSAVAAEPEEAPLPIPSGIISGEIADSGGTGLTGEFPLWGGIVGNFTSLATAGSLDLRYRIWTLVGEPVFTFVAKGPRLDTIRLSDGHETLLEIRALDSLDPDAVSWNGDREVLVARNLMDAAFIYDFSFYAKLAATAIAPLPKAYRVDESTSRSRRFRTAAIYRRYPGIVGRGGGWGWDVPGSPDWSRTFSYRSQISLPFTTDSYDALLYDDQRAREIMRRLLYAYHVQDIAPIHILHTGAYRVSVSNLLHAIATAEPEAVYPLYGIRSPREQQLFHLVHAYRQRARSDTDRADLARRHALVDRVMTSLEDQVPSSLRAAWQAEAGGDEMDPRSQQVLQDVVDRLQPHLQGDDDAFGASLDDLALQRQIETAKLHFAQARGPAASAAWQRIQDLLELTGSQGQRRVWVIGTAATGLEAPFSGSGLTLTARRSPTTETARERERRLERERQRRERKRKEAEERRQREEAERAHDQRIAPSPARSAVFSVLIPTEMEDEEVARQLSTWAETQLSPSQRLGGELQYYRAAPRYEVQVFTEEDAARAWSSGHDGGIVDVPAPPRRLEAE